MAGISANALNGVDYQENRLKYNGKELQSKELGDGSGLEWYDYKNRFYDHQLGRFFSVDKLADKFPYYSPYQFAGNAVPNAIDLDGLEPAYQIGNNFYMASDVLTHKIPEGAYVPATASGEAAGKRPLGLLEIPRDIIGPPLTALNTFITGQTETGRKAGSLDYIQAAGTLIIAGAGDERGGRPGEVSISPKMSAATQRLIEASKVTQGEGSFVVSEQGTVVPTSQKRMQNGFDAAGIPSTPTQSSGTEYTLPNGQKVRAMDPSGIAPRRASFENANGQPVNMDGRTVQPPRGLTPPQRKQYIRDRTHVQQTN